MIANKSGKSSIDDILVSFYKMTSKNEQDIHLQRLMEIKGIERKRGRSSTLPTERKPKGKNLDYFILVNRQRIKVCKKAFMNVHKVTTKRIRRIANLLESDIIPLDQRGKHPSANAISSSVCSKIHEHISSFPLKESHYSSYVKYYLSADLSVKKMHSLFKIKYPDLDVKYHFYWQYFVTNFNLSFGRPTVDACTSCEAIKTKLHNKSLNDNAKRTYNGDLMVHLNRAKKFYKQIQNCTKLSKENNKILSISIDFMAVTDLPRIPVQDIYYYRQLSVNTFGIYNFANDKIHTYVYHEGTGHKGPDEVCSMLLHYFNNFLDQDYEELNLFCDNCAGQNKNHSMIRFMMALVETKVFKKINLYFPIRGHSFLPCDRGFGIIKRKLKTIDRIYTINDYVEKIILECSNIHEKFIVYLMSQNDILNFQSWYQKFFYKTKVANNTLPGQIKEKFSISKYHEFNFSSDEPHCVTVKEFINGFISFQFILRKTNVPDLQLPTEKLYSETVPIKKNKMDDLKKLKDYIPDEAMEFWGAIYDWSVE